MLVTVQNFLIYTDIIVLSLVFIGLVENAIIGEDKGVIYDVLRLYAEVKIEEVIGLLTQALYELVKKEAPTSKIFINSGKSAGPDLQVDDIHAKLNKAFLSSDWTYKKLIRRVRDSCFSPHRKHMPDRSEMSSDQIAEHFQVL